MRFYAQARLVRISLPLLNLALCVFQIQSAVRHPSTEHTFMAICWGLITFLNAINFWARIGRSRHKAYLKAEYCLRVA